MKKILFTLCLMITLNAFSQNELKFNEPVHKFGKIKQNVPASYTFTFTNNGNKPAVIEFATAECGCTTPEYSKEPIAKGASSQIKVTYNAGALGVFKKKVTVKFANVAEPVVLTIEGEVTAAGSK